MNRVRFAIYCFSLSATKVLYSVPGLAIPSTKNLYSPHLDPFRSWIELHCGNMPLLPAKAIHCDNSQELRVLLRNR
jgi:hypothetical protein